MQLMREANALPIKSGGSELKTPWQISGVDQDTAVATIETVERGEDVPSKGYHIARTYSYGGDDPGPVARAIADLPEILELLRRVVNNADRYSDAMREVGRGNSQFGSDADSVSLSGMSRAMLRKHGIIE